MIPAPHAQTQEAPSAGKRICAGLFVISLATLTLELLLTRIFSVTMSYHFAFMAISIAMFGSTVGGLLMFLAPNRFVGNRLDSRLSILSMFFSGSILLALVTHVLVPFAVQRSFVALGSIAFTYSILSIPFIFSGLIFCMALAKCPRQAGKLYAANLTGAAAGCLLFYAALRIMDAVSAVFLVASLACLGAALFGWGQKWRGRIAAVLLLALAAFTLVNAALTAHGDPLLRLRWVRGRVEAKPLYEKWNSHSRVHVQPSADPNRLDIMIDVIALTEMRRFEGDLETLKDLENRICNLAHHLRKKAKVLVVGSGGGIDVLSALRFGQASVLGVELNETVLNILNRRYGDFTGHLDRNPKVRFVNDEARSYVSRLSEKFDIIQVAYVDTFAATAAGAYALSEHALYTIEGWKMFLNHLNPSGILTFTRFYYPPMPGEAYRLVSLASASLAEAGIQDPRRHILMVKNRMSRVDWVATILVSPDPYSGADLDRFEEAATRMGLDVVLSPRFALNPTFEKLASGVESKETARALPIDVSAPTDNRPFFLNMLRLQDTFNPARWNQGIMTGNMSAVRALGFLLITVVLLTLACILVPLWARSGTVSFHGSGPFLVFFSSIGLGFMFIEISQLHRFSMFLGHPSYGLSVVLFTLLLSSGLGSYFTQKAVLDRGVGGTRWLGVLLIVLLIAGFATPHLTRLFQTAVTPVRILCAGLFLSPLGFVMGMPFPLGMKLAAERHPSLTPWFWGANGATSVLASVLAVGVSLSFGISAAYWTGYACYAVAFMTFAWMVQTRNYRS